jgi:hypothetical protein
MSFNDGLTNNNLDVNKYEHVSLHMDVESIVSAYETEVIISSNIINEEYEKEEYEPDAIISANIITEELYDDAIVSINIDDECENESSASTFIYKEFDNADKPITESSLENIINEITKNINVSNKFYKKLFIDMETYNCGKYTNSNIIFDNIFYRYFTRLHYELCHNLSSGMNNLISMVLNDQPLVGKILFLTVDLNKLIALKISDAEFDNNSVKSVFHTVYVIFYESIYADLYNKLYFKLIKQIVCKKLHLTNVLNTLTVPHNNNNALDNSTKLSKMYIHLKNKLNMHLTQPLLKRVYEHLMSSRKEDINQIIYKQSQHIY